MTNSKIGLDAVNRYQIQDGEVVEALLGTGAVTENKIGAGAVTNSKIGTNAINRYQIQDGEVLNAALGPASVTNAKIASDAVGPANLFTGSIPIVCETASVVHTDTNAAWGALTDPALFRFYKVASANSLIIALRVRRNATGGTHYFRASINSGAVYSPTISVTTTPYGWGVCTADITSITDDSWVEVEIEAYDSTGAVNGYLAGFTMFLTD